MACGARTALAFRRRVINRKAGLPGPRVRDNARLCVRTAPFDGGPAGGGCAAYVKGRAAPKSWGRLQCCPRECRLCLHVFAPPADQAQTGQRRAEDR